MEQKEKKKLTVKLNIILLYKKKRKYNIENIYKNKYYIYIYIYLIKGFWTIVFIFIVISTMFWPKFCEGSRV